MNVQGAEGLMVKSRIAANMKAELGALTLAAVSARSGISQKRLSLIKCGDVSPTVAELLKIAKALAVNPAILLAGCVELI